jgi:hypothetical protein
MDDKDKDIFTIRLNAEGINRIIRFCRVVRIILLLSILASVPAIVTGILAISKSASYIIENKFIFKLQYRVFPYVWLFYIIFWQTQIFFYWKFSKRIKRSMVDLNEEKFNESFIHLINNARLMIVVIAISILGNGFSLLLQIKYQI